MGYIDAAQLERLAAPLIKSAYGQYLQSDSARAYFLMKVVPTELPDVLLLEPKIYGDDRGHFFESYNRRVFAKSAGIDVEFVQENQSRSSAQRTARLALPDPAAAGQAGPRAAREHLRRGSGYARQLPNALDAGSDCTCRRRTSAWPGYHQALRTGSSFCPTAQTSSTK